MDFKKIPIVWKNKGKQPPKELQENGYMLNDHPLCEHHNFLFALFLELIEDIQKKAKQYIDNLITLTGEHQKKLTDHTNQIEALKKPVHQIYDFTRGDMLGWSAVRGAAGILSGDGLIPCAWIRNDAYCGMRVRLGNAINFVDGRTYKAIIFMAANHGSDPLRVGVEFWKADGGDNHIVKQSFLDVAHDREGHKRYEVTFTFNAADFADGDGGVYMCIFSAPNVTSTNIFVSSVELTEETDVVGNLADLNTTAKENVVAAVNEVKAETGNHASNKNNPHAVTKAQVGLSNVNNTSDTNKPVSKAQQKAIDDAMWLCLEMPFLIPESNEYTDRVTWAEIDLTQYDILAPFTILDLSNQPLTNYCNVAICISQNSYAGQMIQVVCDSAMEFTIYMVDGSGTNVYMNSYKTPAVITFLGWDSEHRPIIEVRQESITGPNWQSHPPTAWWS